MTRNTFVIAVVGMMSRAAIAAPLEDVRPLIAKYCADCHGDGNDTAFTAAHLDDPLRLGGDRRLVAKLLAQLETNKMPPADEPQPSADERGRLVAWAKALSQAEPARPEAFDPGKVVMRRLSRYEYANTVRDLFQMSKPAWRFSPPPGAPFPEQGVEYSSRTLKLPWNLPPDEIDYGFDNIGDVLTMSPFLLESYFEIGGLVVDRVAADTVPDATQGDKARRMKVLPIRPTAAKSEEAAARENLALLVERAFRRPVTEADVEPLVKLFTSARQTEATFDAAMQIPLRAILVAPDFLFRVERAVAAGGEARPLNDYELASRLSYFLWSSMPDAELFRLARDRKLSEPAILEEQVRRMLRDPRAESLAEHFAPLWLGIDDVQAAMPDPMLYAPFYQRFLGGTMRTEAIMLFDSLITRDRSILDLIDSRTTFANDKLAEYYGLIPKSRNQYAGFAFWREFQQPPGRQAGVLSLGAVAVMTSTPTRSSPVKRGKWVLETILGDPPPPPPANVEELKEGRQGEARLSFREKLERHRDNPNCAACHQAMDPLGFTLENLDAIGRWRDMDGDAPVDAVGTLADGTTLVGLDGLKQEILTNRRDEFARCLTEHLLTYALGRKREWYDQATVAEIVARLRENDYRFSTLAVEIVKSRPFRYTRQVAMAETPQSVERGKVILSDDFKHVPAAPWRTGKGKWEIIDGALKAGEIPAEMHAASARHPLAARNVVVQCDVRLDGARHVGLKFNGAASHCCQLVVAPDGVSLQQYVADDGTARWTEMDRRPTKLDDGNWHTITWEIRGPEVVGSLDGAALVRGRHASIDVDKTTFILNVAGESASFRNLRISDAATK